jgi:hypothetical protein
MTVEYEWTKMLLCALHKRHWRKAITKLGLNPLNPHTFEYGKLKDTISSKLTAAEAMEMIEFVTSTATPMTTNGTTAPLTSPASMDSINPTALTTSQASTASPTSIATPAPSVSNGSG